MLKELPENVFLVMYFCGLLHIDTYCESPDFNSAMATQSRCESVFLIPDFVTLQVLDGLECSISDYERETGRAPAAQRLVQPTFTGYTTALIDAVTRLTAYLKEVSQSDLLFWTCSFVKFVVSFTFSFVKLIINRPFSFVNFLVSFVKLVTSRTSDVGK